MASISIGGPRRLTALLRELACLTRAETPRVDVEPDKRHYPPKRERVIESAAMRREMYRL